MSAFSIIEFQENIETAREQQRRFSSVSIDDDDIAPVEEEARLICPLCKVSTGESEAVDNHFLVAGLDSDEGYEGQENHLCVVSEKRKNPC